MRSWRVIMTSDDSVNAAFVEAVNVTIACRSYARQLTTARLRHRWPWNRGTFKHGFGNHSVRRTGSSRRRIQPSRRA